VTQSDVLRCRRRVQALVLWLRPSRCLPRVRVVQWCRGGGRVQWLGSQLQPQMVGLMDLRAAAATLHPAPRFDLRESSKSTSSHKGAALQGRSRSTRATWYVFHLRTPLVLEATDSIQANFPNLRRLFIEARTDNEERDFSRRAVSSVGHSISGPRLTKEPPQFYNAVLFLGSVAVFSLIGQRMNASK